MGLLYDYLYRRHTHPTLPPLPSNQATAGAEFIRADKSVKHRSQQGWRASRAPSGSVPI